MASKGWWIDKQHPAEYAGQWGSDRNQASGLLYNALDYCQHTDKPRGNPQWDADDWERFADAVRAQRIEVAESLARHGAGYDPADVPNLEKLERWGRWMAGKQRTDNPFVSKHG